MRKNVSKVIALFERGAAGKGDSKGTCSTDGSTVYSYRMPIAWRVEVCEDHADCRELEAMGRECAAKAPIRILGYADAPTATTRSQVRALERAFPGALRVNSNNR